MSLPEITFADLVVPPAEPELVDWEVLFKEYLIGRHRFQRDIDKYNAQVETLTEDIGMTDSSFKILEGLGPQVALWRRWQSLLKLATTIEVVQKELDIGLYDKVVLASAIDRPLDLLREAFKSRGALGTLYAGTPPERKRKMFELFKKKNYRVLCAHIPGMNPAADLSAASQLLFVDASWLPGQNEMAVRRLWRAEQKNPVTVRFVGLSGSADQRLSQLMKRALRGACLKTAE